MEEKEREVLRELAANVNGAGSQGIDGGQRSES